MDGKSVDTISLQAMAEGVGARGGTAPTEFSVVPPPPTTRKTKKKSQLSEYTLPFQIS